MIRGLLVLLLAASSAWSKPLSPEYYLYKISYRLTGKWPSANEYEELRQAQQEAGCQQVSCLENYFRTFIRKKLDTPEFYSEAVLKVFEKFGLQTPGSPPFPSYISSSTRGEYEPLIVYRVFKKDLAVDELFTSQTYWRVKSSNDSIFPTNDEFPINGKNSNADQLLDVTDLKELYTEGKYTEINLLGHANIAGLFSTKKFLDRYWNTPVNGNRKRAAAIFKIMLCDPMAPALERDVQKSREESLALGISETQSEERTLEEIHRNRHASQRDCRQCHMRLDPVARTIRPLELGVSSFSSPGRLRYYDSFKMMKDIPVKNFSSLIKEMTRQQQYTDCQLNWLFSWIVGKNVNIHPSQFATLIDEFENNGRKIKTTIENLLWTPEFRGENPLYVEAETLTHAKAVLKNCSECHGSFLNTGGKQLVRNIKKIIGKLDLTHDGADREMPPDYNLWQPKRKDIMTIKAWIQQGAPLLKDGKALLSDEEVNQLLHLKGDGK